MSRPALQMLAVAHTYCHIHTVKCSSSRALVVLLRHGIASATCLLLSVNLSATMQQSDRAEELLSHCEWRPRQRQLLCGYSNWATLH